MGGTMPAAGGGPAMQVGQVGNDIATGGGAGLTDFHQDTRRPPSMPAVGPGQLPVSQRVCTLHSHR